MSQAGRDPDVLDALFREAVTALDAGELATLDGLLARQPRLVRDRLDTPGAWLRDVVGAALDGFFHKPYLLWFVAEDPARSGTLPRHIAQLTLAIIQAAQREHVDTLQEQLDYALRLVSWSGVAAACGVQIELIDVLVDAGASPDGNPDNALVNGHAAAAEHLVGRGATVTLATALCLGRWDDVAHLAPAASARDRQFGFVLAALNGKADALRRMIEFGIDIDSPSEDLYSHATPLHHAVCSGSLEAVSVLVEAGAKLSTRDTAEDATPLGWAEYYQGEYREDERENHYAKIAAYLRDQETRP